MSLTMRRLLVDLPILVWLSVKLQLGRWSWLVPVIALLWPAYQALSLLAGWRPASFEPEHAQNTLIGVPLYVLAIGLGVRIIAGEIEQRTLEVTYTVPGGARRVWIAKLAAAALPLVVAEALLAIIAAAFFTAVPLQSLYGAFQGAMFYLVLSMGLGALMRSEITAVLVAGVVLFFNGIMTGFGEAPTRFSPAFNPLALPGDDAAQALAFTVQNRTGVALVILGIVALSCVRAERREELLRV